MLKNNFFNFKLKNLSFFNQILLLRSKLFFFKIQRKNLKIFKFFDDRRIGSLPRILIASIFIVFTFYLLPLISSYTKKNFMITNEFQNNSKSILAYTLNKKNEGTYSDNELNEKDLLIDIFSLNDLETDTVRLNASTIKQLFEDTDYKLDDVRQKKLVKPVALTLLPAEIKMIENTKKRKEFFIQIVLPLILKENNNIRLDRKTLFNIINKSNNTKIEKKWLKNKFKQYGIPSKDLSILKIRMDEIPVSLAIAQAAKETGWGTSRFAQEGNALFGQWTWSGEGLKPKEADENKGHKVMKFNVLQASVRAYQRNLNTHSSYENFRLARAQLRDSQRPLDSILLSQFLKNYAETGNQYVEVLQKIIKQNNLKDFDDAKLLPSSIELESLT
ncbi:glucosaminidase domain-containing protein [Pelagibacterales bacterium SAG-MED11]|nr:glucosaminidase domain-containing protein [Pelagibacterales bacterium SAG-MED11]